MSDMKKLGIKGGYKSATPPIEKSGLNTNKKIPATTRSCDRERLAPEFQYPQFALPSQLTG
jgi:hypothetical protein